MFTRSGPIFTLITKYVYVISRIFSKEVNLDNRIFNNLIILAGTVAIFSGLVNVFLVFDLLTILIPFFSGVLFAFIFWLTNHKKYYHLPRFLFLGYAYIGLVVIWFLNGGVDGPMSLYFFSILIIFVTIFRKNGLILLFSNASLFVILVLIQYYYPETVVGYRARQLQMIDWGVNYVILSISVLFLIRIIVKAYDREHDLVESQKNSLEILNRKLKEQALVDPLTGIANRRKFFQTLESEESRFDRYKRPFSLIMMDLDHFKSINDQYGHQFGDQVLIQFARCVHNEIRPSDLLGRLGGEEFGIILPDSVLDSSSHLAERILQLTSSLSLQTPDQKKLRLTVSIGISEFTESDTVSSIYHRADENLYRAKREGRNQVAIDV